MNKLRIIIGVMICAAGLLLQSCDKVEAPYKENTQSGGDPVNPEKVMKNAVIFEFTGHMCPNCPAAAEIAHELKGIKKDKLSIVAIHAGVFARKTSSFPQDFNTDLGTKWNSELIVQSYPIGVVNWVEDPSSNTLLSNPSNWGATVQSETAKEADASIKLESEKINDSDIKISAKVKFTKDVTGAHNLLLLVTEDKIIGKQKVDKVTKDDYEFNSVLRASITDGFYGESIHPKSDNPVVNENYDMVKTLKVQDGWVKDNLNVVAVLFKTKDKIADYEILQVKEISLK
ncbi:MAG: Omp28-related outer membrane protein [Bacteroidales bacterium]